MANIKISALPAASAVTSDDLVPIVNAPGTTPETQKATAEQVKTYVTTDINTPTDFKVNTDKFVVAASSGDTTVGGTLTVGGVTYTWPDAESANTYLKTDGSGTLTWGATSTAVIDYQAFTSSGTWTKPDAGNMALIECWGGGGSGAKLSVSGDRFVTGGCGGMYTYRVLRLSELSSTESVTVGAGGAAVTSDGYGNDGGVSSLGSVCSAKGGGGGVWSDTSTIAILSGPNGGVSVTDNIAAYSTSAFFNSGYAGVVNGGATVYGGASGGGCYSASDVFYAGAVGTSQFGGAGGLGKYDANGVAGSAPGGGGGGQALTYTSGAGARGEVRITVW